MKKMSMVLALAGILAAGCQSGRNSQDSYDWERDLEHRLSVDFCKTRDEVKEHIRKYIPDVTDCQIDKWTEEGILESMPIDGQTMYFRRTAPNLFRVNPECKAIKDRAEGIGPAGAFMDFTGAASESLLDAVFEAGTEHATAHPVKMRVKYTLTVDADAVPGGEIIRCWLPFPRNDVPRQSDVKLLQVNADVYRQSEPSVQHSSIYVEKVAQDGLPTVFEEEFEFTSSAEFFSLSEQYVIEAAEEVLGQKRDFEGFTNTQSYYDCSSELYKKHTGEREKHIVFSERMNT